MKALVLKQFGSTENFSMEEISEPQVGKGEVLIQVKAIGINPVDVKTRAGGGQAAQYKENQPIVIGWDVAGIVTKAADDVTGFAVGDEVFGTINFPGTAAPMRNTPSVRPLRLPKSRLISLLKRLPHLLYLHLRPGRRWSIRDISRKEIRF